MRVGVWVRLGVGVDARDKNRTVVIWDAVALIAKQVRLLTWGEGLGQGSGGSLRDKSGSVVIWDTVQSRCVCNVHVHVHVRVQRA